MTTAEVTIAEELRAALHSFDLVAADLTSPSEELMFNLYGVRSHIERALSKIQIARCEAQTAIDKF